MNWPRHILNLPNQLQRWLLFSTRFFRVFLHHIEGRDPDRAVHNHPWVGLAIVLHGGYVQERLSDGVYKYEFVRWFNYLGKDEYHRITAVRPNTWTLFIGGKKFRDWGFMTDIGHVPWREYLGMWDAPDLDD